jgi:hypothetical protein
MQREEKEVAESHTLWADVVHQRTKDIVEDSNWYPFMQSIEDVISRISFLDGKIDRLSNEIGETRGMVRNLRKVLIKLEVVDDRFVF